MTKYKFYGGPMKVPMAIPIDPKQLLSSAQHCNGGAFMRIARHGSINLFLDHADDGSRAFFDTDAAALAVIVVDLTLHGALIEMDGEVRTELVAVGAKGTDAAVETAFC